MNVYKKIYSNLKYFFFVRGRPRINKVNPSGMHLMCIKKVRHMPHLVTLHHVY